MQLAPIAGSRDVPAPPVVAHCYVIDVERIERRRAFNGVLYCDTSGVYFLLGATMAKFAVYADGMLVGHSLLELGDPPMGVAFGVFLPTEAYSEIAHECRTNHADQSHLHLSVRTESGVVVPCAGVGIQDYSGDIDPPYIEVNVLGIPYPLYGELFPEHVAHYDQQFSQASPPAGVKRSGA
jgi:hypothetical protein